MNDSADNSARASVLDRAIAWALRPAVAIRFSFALLFLLYVRVVAFDLVYDDLYSLVAPPARGGWQGIVDLFTHDLFAASENLGKAIYYRPMSGLFGTVIGKLTGGAPGWMHLAAVFVHIAVFYLAYLTGKKLLKNEAVAMLGALLYALHPTKVEVVAWIGASLCDGLTGLLFFGTLLCYLNWYETRKPLWLIASLFGFAAALLTKETMIALPPLVAMHFFLKQRNWRGLLRTCALMLPYAAVAGGYMLLRHAVLPHDHIQSVPVAQVGAAAAPNALWSIPFAAWWYLKHLTLPTGLAVMYDSNVVLAPTLSNFWLPLIAVALVTAVALWQLLRARSSCAWTLAAWFGLTLAPYLLMTATVRVHDRYLYLASFPFCALIAFVIVRVGDPEKQVHLRVAVAGMLIVLFAVSTWHETTFWDNDPLLWKRAGQVAPTLLQPCLNHALTEYSERNVEGALRILDEGLKLHPDSPSLWSTRGAILNLEHRYDEARQCYLRAFNSKLPDTQKPAEASALGQIDLTEGNYASAEHWFRVAIELNPRAPGQNLNLALALEQQGRKDEAVQYRRQEAEIAKRLRIYER